jgi:small neutral amino acid transporter SnatA (MarC family)
VRFALGLFSLAYGRTVLLGMLLIVAVIDFGVFLASHWLDNWLTRERILVMEKVLGILLAALADVGVITLSGGH